MSQSEGAFVTLPDPGRTGTLDELVEGLRRLKVWAGAPSYDTITGRINAAWTATGRPRGELAGRTTVADCFRPGRRRLNADLARQALSIFRETGDRDGEAWALNGLGEAAHAVGHPTDALTHHTIAHAIATDISARDQQARAHTGLGHAHHTLANPVCARRHYGHALTLYTSISRPDADQIRAHLAAIDDDREPAV